VGALIATVHVHEVPQGESQRVFSPGDDVPEWAARQMGAHCFEDGEHPYPEVESQDRPAGTPPAKAGRGSGRDNWIAYAAEQGVEIPDGANRDAIIQAIVDAGKPVDPQ
jgi:hypothetical protein